MGRVRGLKELLCDAQALVVVRVGGVPTRELNQLRNSLIAQQANLTIVKNSLSRIALRDLGWVELEKHLEGGTCGLAPIRGELSAVAKLLAAFSKGHDRFTLQAGLLQGQFLSSQDLVNLSKLPSREVLLAQLAGMAISPLRQLAFLCQGPLRSLVILLNGLIQKKGKGETSDG